MDGEFGTKTMTFQDIVEIFLLGAGLASCWFYVRSLLTGDLTRRAVYNWAASIVPMGIAIAWGLKIMGVL